MAAPRTPPRTMDELLAPMGWAAFRQDYLGRQPLHIKGEPGKLDGVLDWDGLSGLLAQTRIWSSATLGIVLDRSELPARDYCRPDVNRDGAQALMADMARVGALIAQGASIVLNDVQSLAPGIRAVADALTTGLGGRVQANIYCSRPGRQGFDVHFDKHDVYAVHVAGVKRWRIYGRHFVDPVPHPRFSALGQAFHEASKGALSQEVALEPGDLLYLPRGWYHEALAQEGDALHVAFSVTPLVGLDALQAVIEAAVDDPAFRANLDPRGDNDRGRLAKRLAGLGDRLAAVMRSPELADAVHRQIEEHRRPAYAEAPTMPAAGLAPARDATPAGPASARYRVAAAGLAVRQTPQGWVLTDGRKATGVPPGLERRVAWMLERGSFGLDELCAAFPEDGRAGLDRLVSDLARMRVLAAG